MPIGLAEEERCAVGPASRPVAQRQIAVQPGGSGLADRVVNSALLYRAQTLLLDFPLSGFGSNGVDSNGLAGNRHDRAAVPMVPDAQETG